MVVVTIEIVSDHNSLMTMISLSMTGKSNALELDTICNF